MDDKFHEECGVFGVCGDANAVMHTAIGLCALQTSRPGELWSRC